MSKQAAFDHTHAVEGGWYAGDLPSDSNPTMWGVIQETYDSYRVGRGLAKQTVRRITKVEADEIYQEFWDDSHAAELPAPIDALHFAYAINAGPSGKPWAAIEVLQRVLGVAPDGKVGPNTRAAIALAAKQPQLLFYDLVFEQLGEYRRMIKSPRLAPNARSWMQRLIMAHQKFRLELFPKV